jgi:hypothetical protein
VSAHAEHHAPVEGPLWTRTFTALVVFTAVAMLVVLYRFVYGIGAVSALNDGYAWGSWKVVNVVVLTAVGSGGFATAVLVYFLNRQRYHSLVRVAILTSAMAYTTGVFALGMDIGRPWNMWVILKVWEWNLHSVLLEIAVCVTLYIAFLWIEMAMPMLERWRASDWPKLRSRAETVSPLARDRVSLDHRHGDPAADDAPVVARLALPAGRPADPPALEHRLPAAALPGQRLLHGLGVVAWSRNSRRWSGSGPMDMPLLAAIGRIMGWVLVAFLALRGPTSLARRARPRAFAFDLFAAFFLLEMPAARRRRRRHCCGCRSRAGPSRSSARDGTVGARRLALPPQLLADRVHAGRALVVLPVRAGAGHQPRLRYAWRSSATS